MSFIASPFFGKKFRVMTGLSLGAYMPNLKLVSSAVLELFAQKFTGSCDPSHALFYPLLTIGDERPPSDVVSTMNRYNRSTDNEGIEGTEKCFNSPIENALCRYQFGAKWGKIGDTLIGFRPRTKVFFRIRFQTFAPNFVKIG